MDMNRLKERFSSMNKKTIAGLLAIAGIGLFWTASVMIGGEEGQANVPKQEKALTAPVMTVARQRINALVTAAGALSSRNSSVLSSKVMGRITFVGAREGDRVSAGKLLLRIESGEIIAQAAQAQAAFNNAKLQYDRIKGLYDAKASTQVEMDQATLGLESAQAGLTAAKAMESYTTIIAPISGQIVEKRINLGEMAMPGQPLIRIEDNRNLRLEVTVREQDILHIRTGGKAKVEVDAMPGVPITGTVAQVVQASDVRTHSFVVKIDIPSRDGLITGMYGKAFFPIGSKEVVLVPKNAVVELSGITGVYTVPADGAARFQMVQLGDAQGDRVEVLTGLADGDRVVTDNRLGRIDGRKIVEK